MNFEEFKSMINDMLTDALKMGYENYIQAKLELLAVSKHDTAEVRNLIQQFFRVADDVRPKMLEMK